MDIEITKFKVVSNIFWKLLDRSGAQGLQFVLHIILARLLIPEDYGIMALVAIFIAIANVFIQRGFNTALIQKKDADEIDFSSSFYISLSIAVLMYIIIFLTAPYIASFFSEPQLIIILRILSIIIFFGTINSIQNAIIARNMQFKILFIYSFAAIAISGVISIILAYKGFGVWSLVVNQLLNQVLITTFLWFRIKWRPRFLFSYERSRSLLSYGWKMLASSLIDSFYMNLSGLIIGKLYNPEILGFYKRGQQFPEIIALNIDGSIHAVLLPALASQQDNLIKVKEMMRRSITTSSFIVFPIMVCLAVTAEPLVKILLTENWIPSVPFIQIYCAVYALWPIHTSNLQAINALGRSDIFLKLEVIKKIVGFFILGITIYFGVYAIALGGVASGIVSTYVNAYPNSKLLNYSYKEQFKDIFPPLLLSILIGIVIYAYKWLNLSDIFTVLLQMSSGFLLYIGFARLLQLECYTFIESTGKDIIEYWKSGNK